MDSGDPTRVIIAKIRTLEPENALKIIAYFLLHDMKKCDLIRMAFGPDILVQNFCRKAKSHLRLPSNDFSFNLPSSRPFNIHDHSLSQSSPRNGFLEFSRNPNPLFPSFTSNTLEGSSQQQLQLSNHFPFRNNENPIANLHKRSFSANDAFLESEELELRFLPRGLIDDFGSPDGFGLPSERMKLAPEQRKVAAAQFMAASGSSMSHRQGSGQFGEEGGYCYSPARHERKDSGISKTIFLSFPPESSFTDADVLIYFSKYGAVEDVQLPYNKNGRRTFGFVHFANAQTVRTVLAQRNPHRIGDSLVIVKPYKEKGKFLPRMQQQQMMEGGNYSPSSYLSGLLDSMELEECRFGPRMFSNKKQEMLQRKTEEAYLQQAIEVEHQRTRVLNLQLPDMESKSSHHNQHCPSIDSIAHFPPLFSHSRYFQSAKNEEIMEGDTEKHPQQVATGNGEERCYSNEFYKGQETNVENTLPDSLFDSPKPSGETESDTEYSKPSNGGQYRQQEERGA